MPEFHPGCKKTFLLRPVIMGTGYPVILGPSGCNQIMKKPGNRKGYRFEKKTFVSTFRFYSEFLIFLIYIFDIFLTILSYYKDAAQSGQFQNQGVLKQTNFLYPFFWVPIKPKKGGFDYV